MKHTKGPWELHSDGIRTWVTSPGRELYVTEPFRLQQLSTEPMATAEARIERHVADAKLISKAPELLQSLKEIMELFEETIESCGGHKEFFGCDHSVGLCNCGAKRVYDDAKEIIAQAEGKQ